MGFTAEGIGGIAGDVDVDTDVDDVEAVLEIVSSMGGKWKSPADGNVHSRLGFDIESMALLFDRPRLRRARDDGLAEIWSGEDAERMMGGVELPL